MISNFACYLLQIVALLLGLAAGRAGSVIGEILPRIVRLLRSIQWATIDDITAEGNSYVVLFEACASFTLLNLNRISSVVRTQRLYFVFTF